MSIVLTDLSTSPCGFRATREYERCLYQELFGSCFYEPRTRALTIRTHTVRAVMAPEDLAEAAVGRLHGYLPIVTLVHRSGPGVWVFLTHPPASGDDPARVGQARQDPVDRHSRPGSRARIADRWSIAPPLARARADLHHRGR